MQPQLGSADLNAVFYGVKKEDSSDGLIEPGKALPVVTNPLSPSATSLSAASSTTNCPNSTGLYPFSTSQ